MNYFLYNPSFELLKFFSGEIDLRGWRPSRSGFLLLDVEGPYNTFGELPDFPWVICPKDYRTGVWLLIISKRFKFYVFTIERFWVSYSFRGIIWISVFTKILCVYLL